MITNVTNVFVSNAKAAVLAAAPTVLSSNTASTQAGQFILMNCDEDVTTDKLYEVKNTNAGDINKIKIGIVTNKNYAVHKKDGTVSYYPIVKWSNEIQSNSIKDYNVLSYVADTEDSVVIDLDPTKVAADIKTLFAEGGKRIILRITYKDLPTRYRKWTESYEYVTVAGDTMATIATNLAAAINTEWKRARVKAVVSNNTTITITALPYDDDNSSESISWAAKVRFNVNMYYTDPQAAAFASRNKYYIQGATITKTPGKQYAASAKLVRDRESIAQGYDGIMNRTWFPVIKPAILTDINAKYSGLTLEFENNYHTADDLTRKTKETVELYDQVTGGVDDVVADSIDAVKAILDAFATRTNAVAP